MQNDRDKLHSQRSAGKKVVLGEERGEEGRRGEKRGGVGRKREEGRRREENGRKRIRVHIQVFSVNWISERRLKWSEDSNIRS